MGKLPGRGLKLHKIASAYKKIDSLKDLLWLLNFIFGILTFKSVLSFQFIEGFFYYTAIAGNYVQVGIGVYILVAALVVLYLLNSKLALRIIFSPFKVIKKGVTLWHELPQNVLLIPIKIGLSYILFLFGVVFLAVLWGFIIGAFAKTLFVLADIAYDHFNKNMFGYLVSVLFIICTFLNFLIHKRERKEKVLLTQQTNAADG